MSSEWRDALIGSLEQECDAREKQWREAHKNDPCAHCGSLQEVEIIPFGSVAKLTPLCVRCRDKSRADTNIWHEGFYAGYRTGLEEAARQPWWKRLFR